MSIVCLLLLVYIILSCISVFYLSIFVCILCRPIHILSAAISA